MSDPFGGDRPTAEAIDSLFRHLDPLWSAVRAKMAEDDTFHNGTFAVWKNILEQRPSYHPPKSRYLIDNAVDRQISVEPSFKKFPVGKGREHEDRANRVEVGLAGVWASSSMMEPYIPVRQAYRHLIQYGYTVMGMQLAMEDKPKEPKRKDGESDEDWKARQDVYEANRTGWNYIRIRAPHPARVLLDPLQRQPNCAIITAQRYSSDLYDLVRSKARYGNRQVGSYETNSNPYKLEETLEVWTPEWHAMKLKNGGMLFLEKNTLGFQPWVHAFAGWGGEETNSSMDTEGLAASLAVSMIEGIKELLRADAQKASAIHNAVLEHGFPQMGADRPEEVAQALARPGGILPGTKDQVWWLEHPELKEYVFRSMENDDQEIRRATLALDQSGERQQGVSTVGQQMILQENSNQKFYVPNKQLEWLTSITASNICRAVDATGESLAVRGVKLTPEDIDGGFDVVAEFKRVNVVLQMQQNQQDVTLADHKYISAETLRERMGLENETEERDRLVDMELDAMPAVHEEIVALALAKRGFKDLSDHMLEMIRMKREQARAGMQTPMRANNLPPQGPQAAPTGAPMTTGVP